MQPVQNSKASTSERAASGGQAAARTISAVILAGRLRQAPLQESLNLHLLCLPVGRSGTLLEAWIAALRSVPDIGQIRVVVNNAEDASAVRGVLPRELRQPSNHPRIEVIAEPASWRGAGGIVRDVTEGLPDDAVILVCEGTRLPPCSLQPLLTAIDSNGDPRAVGAVGVCGDQPAGVYAFRRKAVNVAPKVGYFDLKEQFLPALANDGERVVVAELGESNARLRDVETYLETVRSSLNHQDSLSGGDPPRSLLRVSSRASVSGSAVLDGFCIIEPGAVIEDGAVVHDSVVLWGATVGGGAVVSRSVIGPLASVEPRTRVVRGIAARR
jgi:hypothetical protein